MQAIAFSNNDIAVIAWDFGGRLKGCLGFAIYRTDVSTGTEVCLPALATFQGQQATAGRTTEQDPVQKFFWKDVYAKRGGSYRYRIVPLSGQPGRLEPMRIGSLTTDLVKLSGAYGVLSAFFNRGILATQATAHALDDVAGNLDAMKKELLNRIVDPTDPLRLELAGDMTQALTMLPQEAASKGGTIYGALYEYQDPELLKPINALAGKANIVLSNMPGTDEEGKKTDDTYAAERADSKAKGVLVTDRMMPSGHIGHNKSIVLELADTPQAVTFGSTNFTSRALCAQSNNTIIARSPILANFYKEYWVKLKADTDATNGKGAQAAPLRQADSAGLPEFELEDGSAKLKLWFSPNTAHARTKTSSAAPVDMAQVFALIAGAKQAILFVVFEPGSPSVVNAIAVAQRANPKLFVRGTTTVESAANVFAVGIKGDAVGDKSGADTGGKILDDYRVIPATGVKDVTGVWEKELNSAGYAVTHSKFVVIDPFTPNCVVVTGSHNLGYQASYNNDENMVIIKGHSAVSRAYAANALDIYDHYAWRWWLAKDPNKAWTSLKGDDSWQDSYLDADGKATSSELAFWLGGAKPTQAGPAASSDRVQPELDAIKARTADTPPHLAASRAASKRTRALARTADR